MRFKLDENLEPGLVPLVQQDGHDADTVHTEGLSGCGDGVIYDVCVATGQVLVTLDR